MPVAQFTVFYIVLASRAAPTMSVVVFASGFLTAFAFFAIVTLLTYSMPDWLTTASRSLAMCLTELHFSVTTSLASLGTLAISLPTAIFISIDVAWDMVDSSHGDPNVDLAFLDDFQTFPVAFVAKVCTGRCKISKFAGSVVIH